MAGEEGAEGDGEDCGAGDVCGGRELVDVSMWTLGCVVIATRENDMDGGDGGGVRVLQTVVLHGVGVVLHEDSATADPCHSRSELWLATCNTFTLTKDIPDGRLAARKRHAEPDVVGAGLVGSYESECCLGYDG